MRYVLSGFFLALSISMCYGYTRNFSIHNSQNKIDNEFSQIEDSLQDKSFTVVPTTPNLRDLQDGQVVIMSSGSFLLFRYGQEIYKINSSCITVTR